MSPIDLERHKPPGQQRRGPICEFTGIHIKHSRKNLQRGYFNLEPTKHKAIFDKKNRKTENKVKPHLSTTIQAKPPNFTSTGCYALSSENTAELVSISCINWKKEGWKMVSHSSTFSSSLWSTVSSETAPPCVSKMQRESPTDATVTVHRSTITNVTVVPEVNPKENEIRRNNQF